jgi:hypothetical protein
LRRVYGERGWSAALKTALIFIAYMVVFSQVFGLAVLLVVMRM